MKQEPTDKARERIISVLAAQEQVQGIFSMMPRGGLADQAAEVTAAQSRLKATLGGLEGLDTVYRLATSSLDALRVLGAACYAYEAASAAELNPDIILKVAETRAINYIKQAIDDKYYAQIKAGWAIFAAVMSPGLYELHYRITDRKGWQAVRQWQQTITVEMPKGADTPLAWIGARPLNAAAQRGLSERGSIFFDKVNKAVSALVDKAVSTLNLDPVKMQYLGLDLQLHGERALAENFVNLRPGNIPDRLALPSLKGYEGALTGYTGGLAQIRAVDDLEFLTDKEFTGGYMAVKGRPDIQFTLKHIKTKKSITSADLDIGLLHGVYSVINRAAERIQGNQIVVKRSQLGDYLGVMTRQGNAYPIMAKLKQFEGIIGVLEDGSYYRLLTVSSYDEGTDLITIDCGFILKLIRTIQGEALRVKRQAGRTVEIETPSHNYLWPTDAAGEKNKNAFQLGVLITDLMLQAGAKGTPRKRFSTLIDQVPSLKAQLAAQNLTRAKNAILQRAFSKAYELIRKKSKAYDYWLDLSITPIVPTWSTINETLKIKHKGINPEYKGGQG